MMVPIATALQNNSTLQTLDLQRNAIGNEGIVALSVALMEAKDSALRSLRLDRNQIGDAGGVALCSMLMRTKERKVLQHVYLEGNRLGDACVDHFLDLMRGHGDMYSLTLHLNKFGPDASAKLGAAYLAHPSIFEKFSSMTLTPEQAAKLKVGASLRLAPPSLL